MNFQNSENPDYSGKSQLELIEESLPRYNSNITEMITRNFPKSNSGGGIAILDFGAGKGSLATRVKTRTSFSPECLELDPQLISELNKAGFIALDSLENVHNKYDFVYTSNVLEHIEDDLSALKQIHSSMKVNAEIAIYVPAFQILFSGLDREVGHVRRYSKSELLSKVSSTGFTITEVKFVDSVGFLASLFLRILGFIIKNGIGSPASLRFYDTCIFPISLSLDKLGFGRIFGKNLFLRATKVSD